MHFKPITFAWQFISLFFGLYYFNILFFGLTSPGNHYNAFLADHLNYIQGLRKILLQITALIVKAFGFSVVTGDTDLLVAGRCVIKVVYSCLGLGVISFFSAFILAGSRPAKEKLIAITAGILMIEVLNVLRFVALILFWTNPGESLLDHHMIFNIFIYTVVIIGLYFWAKKDLRTS